MSKVSGYFSVIKDGDVATTTFTDVDYSKFWVAQKHVIDVLNSLSTISATALLLGQSAPAPMPPVSVGYRYVVSFEGGGSSTGETTWNGVSEADAKFIVNGLNKTAAGLA